MIKIFCGDLTAQQDKKILDKQFAQEIEWIIDQENIKKSHLVFLPSLDQSQEAKESGIPFYSPKKSILRKIRFYLKQILREFLDNFLTFKIIPPPHTESVIVLRVDAIGDYILFRNFLKPLSEKFGKLTLVVNKGVQELVEQCDIDFIDKVIYFERKKFTNNLWYRMRFLRKLRQKTFHTLIHPTYGRDYCGEDIARNIFALRKLAPKGDCSNVIDFHKKRFDKNYTDLLPSTNGLMFEFDRNTEFISQICEIKNVELSIQLPQQNLSHFGLKEEYIVFFIGASASNRKWGVDHLCNLVKKLDAHLQIVICGGFEDWERGEELKKSLIDREINNLCGKTTLVELGLILEGSMFVVSNETSCVHLYMGLKNKKKIYVLSAGNTIVRFIPYPHQYDFHYRAIFHPFICKNFEKFCWITEHITHSGGGLEIDQILFNQVAKQIKEDFPNHIKYEDEEI